MRKITQNAATAFKERRAYSNANTSVLRRGDETTLVLHGNAIASQIGNLLIITNCGWNTPTTKDRLNAILPNGYYIYQKKYQWILSTPQGEKEWDGKPFTIIL